LVYLVGAGPGDPGLITVKALETLRLADVVLYDRLINPDLLLETKPECTLIDVGKSPGSHTKTQDEITNLLVEFGNKGLNVVRLKGGDPLFFGRGGEEVERLSEEGIPFVVIPGVSALNAATTYAGIPVTHRDYSSSVGIVTGHGAKEKKKDPVKWRKLAGGVDTIVVFMGVGNIETIVQEIIAGGFSPDTPAALIEKGSTPLQKVVISTLASISSDARSENAAPPALLIVGNTVSLAEKLKWYNPGPLAGIKIGVTRPFAQSKSFTGKLRLLGAMPVQMPTIKIVETIDTNEVKMIMDNVNAYDYIVFSSTNGVNSFFQALKKRGKDSRILAGGKIASIGPVTSEALLNHGITADITAKTFVAEGLLEAILLSGSVKEKKFLLVRSNIGRNTLQDGLKKGGALVDHAAFYSTQTAELKPYTIEMLKNDKIDIITFTSSSTVEGFFDQISTDELRTKTKIASIGPQTSMALKRHNKVPDIEAGEFTTTGLAEAILAQYVKE